MMKYILKLIAIVIIIFNCSCKNTTENSEEHTPEPKEIQAEPSISSAQSKAIIDHHLQAFMDANIDEFMKDYTDDSVLITNDTVVRGIESIKGLVSGMMQLFPKESSTIEIDKMVVEDELVYFTWNGSSPTIDLSFATDTFIIIDNKIQKQTFAGILTPKPQKE